jgi:putative peptide zinc metalloprotease protein
VNQPARTLHHTRLRKDIRWHATDDVSGRVWIAIDPLKRTPFQCSEEDYQILRWLDELESYEQLEAKFNDIFRPRSIHPSTIRRLIHHGRHQGILRLTQEAANVENLDGKKRSTFGDRSIALARWMQGIFSTRISLANPDALLEGPLQPLQILFARWFAFAALGMTLASVCLVIVHYRELIDCIPGWNVLRSPSALIGYGVVFVITRVIHELGHAVACKRYGVRCCDVGVLVSFGMICPYVDTTDAWKTAGRWQRMMIALGGIYFEWIMAGIAAWVWALTDIGWLHHQAFQIMLVCSVSTLLFNANPLLKYDMYFVLCDWCGIHHLREKSWDAFDGIWSGKLGDSFLSTAMLSSYFLMSLVNRLALTVGLGIFIYSLACQWQLAGVGIGLLLLYTFSGLILAIGQMFSRTRNRSKELPRRTQFLGWIAVMGMALWAIHIPLPNRIWTDGFPSPGTRIPIYAGETGILQMTEGLRNGDRVREGQTLFQLGNMELDRKMLHWRGEQMRLEQESGAAKRLAFYDSRFLDRVPQLQVQLASVSTELGSIQQRKNQCSIQSPATGQFHSMHSHRARSRESDWKRNVSMRPPHRLELGPLDGQLVNKNDLIGFVRVGDEIYIECKMDDLRVGEISVGTEAVVRFLSLPGQLFHGSAAELSSQKTALDVPFARDHTMEPSASTIVRVKLDNGGPTDYIGTRAEVLFLSPKRSILDRTIDFALRNLRWR